MNETSAPAERWTEKQRKALEFCSDPDNRDLSLRDAADRCGLGTNMIAAARKIIAGESDTFAMPETGQPGLRTAYMKRFREIGDFLQHPDNSALTSEEVARHFGVVVGIIHRARRSLSSYSDPRKRTRREIQDFLILPENAALPDVEVARIFGVTPSTVRRARSARPKGDSSVLNLKLIRDDSSIQSRVKMDESVISDYAEKMESGEKFPPVVVFLDGTDHWLADGFHRVHAARAAGFKEIEAEVRMGTKRDAILWSLGANGKHGLQRTNEDKRYAVEQMLADEEWSVWSNAEIARRCGVSGRFVGNMRDALTNVTVNGSQSRSRMCSDGRVINTANISSPGVVIRGVVKPSIPLAPIGGQSLVNGVLTVDPPDVAKARAEGRIAPGVVPDVDEPAESTSVDDVREEIEEQKGKAETDLSDADWLATLPLHSKLIGTQLKTFEGDALSFRELEPARNTYRHHAGRILKGRHRKGAFVAKVWSFLAINGPEKWVLCPAPENGGCGGTGASPITGECSKCYGRGYRING